MRSKNILSIAAFIIAFSGSVALAGLFVVKSSQTTVPTYGTHEYSRSTSCWKSRYKSETAVKITEFINEDVANGLARDRKIYSTDANFRPPFEGDKFPAYAEAVEEYVADMESLDESELPLKFQTAWREHLQDWQNYSEFLDEMKSSASRRKLGSAEILSLDNQHSADISRTWNEVLRIGRNHGADVY